MRRIAAPHHLPRPARARRAGARAGQRLRPAAAAGATPTPTADAGEHRPTASARTSGRNDALHHRRRRCSSASSCIGWLILRDARRDLPEDRARRGRARAARPAQAPAASARRSARARRRAPRSRRARRTARLDADARRRRRLDARGAHAGLGRGDHGLDHLHARAALRVALDEVHGAPGGRCARACPRPPPCTRRACSRLRQSSSVSFQP